jgi:hypothetical protein
LIVLSGMMTCARNFCYVKFSCPDNSQPSKCWPHGLGPGALTLHRQEYARGAINRADGRVALADLLMGDANGDRGRAFWIVAEFKAAASEMRLEAAKNFAPWDGRMVMNARAMPPIAAILPEDGALDISEPHKFDRPLVCIHNHLPYVSICIGQP